MTKRVLSALVLTPIAVLLVWLGGAAYFAGVTIMCLGALWELTGMFSRMIQERWLEASPILRPHTLSASAPDDATGADSARQVVEKTAPQEGAPSRLRVPALDANSAWRYFTLAAGALLLFGIWLGQYRSGSPQAVGAGVLLVSLVGLLLGGPPARRILQWAMGAAAGAYVVGLGLHFIVLRGTDQGLGWTLLACAVTWCTDIGAFFAGGRFGRRPFFKAISPHKTLEGAYGGLAAGIVAAVAVVEIGSLHVPLIAAAFVGLCVSAAAQAGDLVESLVKREARVKDSGTLIPGHGGVLDRIDSLLFAVTVTYYLRLLFS